MTDGLEASAVYGGASSAAVVLPWSPSCAVQSLCRVCVAGGEGGRETRFGSRVVLWSFVVAHTRPESSSFIEEAGGRCIRCK